MTIPDSTRRRWELAQLLRDEDGAPDRPVSVWAWSIPERVGVSADGEWLWYAGHERVYTLGGRLAKGTVRPSPRLLERFLGLADADAEVIASFARQWGVLDVCLAGLPYTHDGDVGEIIAHHHDTECWAPTGFIPGEPDARFERIEDWRLWARTAVSMLNAAAAVHSGQSTSTRSRARATASWSRAVIWAWNALTRNCPSSSAASSRPACTWPSR